MRCMYSLFGLLLWVLIVSPSSEINSLKKAGDERNNIGQGQALERHRRGLWPGGVEYQFFLRYFEAIFRVPEFLSSLSGGLANWKDAFGVTQSISYFTAIDIVVNYYAHHENAGVKRENAIRDIGAIINHRERYNHGHLDHSHQTVVDKWTQERNYLLRVI